MQFFLFNEQAKACKNKQESGIFIEYRRTKDIVVTHPFTPPPNFLSPFFKPFITHPPKINELDTVVTATPVLRP